MKVYVLATGLFFLAMVHPATVAARSCEDVNQGQLQGLDACSYKLQGIEKKNPTDRIAQRKGYEACLRQELEKLSLKQALGGLLLDQTGKTLAARVETAGKQHAVISQINAVQAAIEKISSDKESDEKAKRFLGVNWGVGVAAAYGLGQTRVGKAVLDSGGYVRVEEDTSSEVRLMLEVHRFIKCRFHSEVQHLSGR